MPRLTKIYTRKGDAGYTELAGERISKDDLLLDVIGTLDELNSAIGLIVASRPNDTDVDAFLSRIQNDLFDMGGELHAPDHTVINADKITWLEETLDNWNADLPPLKEFILPRGNACSAFTHLARTICRRAERCLVKLHRQVPLNNPEMLRYLNRLSDVLFVLARVLGRRTNAAEAMWERE
jgi:cob(I)alamin adenosyltransferase